VLAIRTSVYSAVSESIKVTLRRLIQLVESIKGEPPLMPRKGTPEICAETSMAQAMGYSLKGLTDLADIAENQRKMCLLFKKQVIIYLTLACS